MAADPSATSFVEAIYAPYKVKDGKGNPLDSDAAVKRYFEPRLAALIIKDRNKAAKRGDVSTLDMDPFIDAQDWDISAVDVAVRDTGADKASATVSFKNLGKRPPWCLSIDVAVRDTGSEKASATVSFKNLGKADHRGARTRQAQGRVADRRHQLGPQANLARTFHQALRARTT